MDTCEHKERTSLPHCPVLKEPSRGVRRRERGGGRGKKRPRPGPNGGNSAEVKPSFCLLWIKDAFEKQRVFLSHRGPSGLWAMLVPCFLVGVCECACTSVHIRVRGQECRNGEDRVTCSRERNMLRRGCWKEDSISSVYEEEKREDIAIESDRWRGGRK